MDVEVESVIGRAVAGVCLAVVFAVVSVACVALPEGYGTLHVSVLDFNGCSQVGVQHGKTEQAYPQPLPASDR